ncbi:MAG: Gfo/Idh/MocA family protein [Planctomycetota bacterium]|jgi:predicted dehydrogenase
MSNEDGNAVKHNGKVSRRDFVGRATGTITGVVAGSSILTSATHGATGQKGRIRVGLIGCGSVSEKYLPDLLSQTFIDVVSLCDIIVPRAQAKAKQFKVPYVYSHIDKMLKGVDFDLLVNCTSMPAHYKLNKKALQAGKNVWSEKPIANSVKDGQELIGLAKSNGLSLWGAPCCVTSPHFRFMAQAIAHGKLGRVCAAHGIYGHDGSTWLWSPTFFQRGGGSLYDLGVYNITSLTGLLGPAKSVMGMSGIIHPQLTLKTHEGKSVTFKVESEENAMLLMDHGNTIFSHIQTGFTYYSAKHHYHTDYKGHTIDIIGNKGIMHLCGYDWAPQGVDVICADNPKMKTYCTDPGDYTWQHGASYVAKCMLTGEKSLVTAEQAVHVLEIMNACTESQRTGRRVEIKTTFNWPIIS